LKIEQLSFRVKVAVGGLDRLVLGYGWEGLGSGLGLRDRNSR